jgi:glycosyltransferase involved in cell wall biosynthesis
MVHISVVLPVLNESSLIKVLLERVRFNLKSITEDYEIILIDDGSLDETWQIIEKEKKYDKRIRGIKFSRNFGHHYAITAGIHNSNGEWVIVMDGDLQDRPEVIPDLYREAQNGFDVVFVSRKNRPEAIYYKITQKIFYAILRILSGIEFDSRQANFSIISKKVVEAFKNFTDNSRFYGSTIKWLGFKSSHILADHGTRYSGKPSYTLNKRIKLAVDIVLCSSERPIRIATGMAMIISFMCLSYSLGMTIFHILNPTEIDFSVTLNLVIIFLIGGLLGIISIITMYLEKIFAQVKNRPLYIIDQEI